MRSDAQLMHDAIDAYMIGLKGLEHFISEPSQQYNLSFEQYLILRDIIQNPDIKMMHLATKKGVSRSAISRQLKVLLDSGYVTQKADPSDRRSQILSVTKNGRATDKKISAAMLERFTSWLDLYGRERGGKLIDFLIDFGQEIVQGEINDQTSEDKGHD